MVIVTTFLVMLFFLFAYFVGSIPSGYWAGLFFHNKDITSAGSGNSGATNAGRLLGYPFFLLVLLLDAGKAYGTLYLFSVFFSVSIDHVTFLFLSLVLALTLLAGNAYSCFLSFRGGKGVATVLGIYSFFYPLWFVLIFIFSWLIIALVTRKATYASVFTLFLITPVIILYLFFVLSLVSFFLEAIFLSIVLLFVFSRHWPLHKALSYDRHSSFL